MKLIDRYRARRETVRRHAAINRAIEMSPSPAIRHELMVSMIVNGR